ncbi:inositol monophosphatase [Alphaproteobacteria bacterium]|nr:inositol monophosphatase [Alphaproteobacteria bacterium]GHS95837.1 inositol monophosphatase [Alphaproteobacteria bacterium]
MLGLPGRSSSVMNVMILAVQKAARGLVRDFCELEKLQVSRKDFGNFVTTADRRSEDILLEELSHARPEYDFLSEERGEVPAKNPRSRFEQNGGYRWIVDPLDGTTNFWHGVPHFAVSIALEHHQDIVAGVVFNPITDELFWGEKGCGAFLNNQRIRVSGRKSLEAAVISTGSVFGERYAKSAPHKLQSLIGKVGAFRHFGACTLDLAFVAAGRFDAFFETQLPLWDKAAGALLIREAGGYTAVLDDLPESLLGSNEALHDALRRVLNGT